MTTSDVRDLLRQACDASGSQQAWAQEHGVSPQYVGDVLMGRREPGDKILGGLQLRKIVTYERVA